jgi:hypothetical protein
MFSQQTNSEQKPKMTKMKPVSNERMANCVLCSMTWNTTEFKKAWDRALPIDQYLEDLLGVVPHEEDPYAKYLVINQQRVKRIKQRLHLEPETEMAALNAKPGTKWLILNEHWCGDGAQIVPVQAAIALASKGRIEARVLFRDQNLELMDQFLTNGGRSIPKTIQLDSEFRVTTSWGSRPAEAQELVMRVKADPERAHLYSEELHKWYAVDRQQAIQSELRMLLSLES